MNVSMDSARPRPERFQERYGESEGAKTGGISSWNRVLMILIGKLISEWEEIMVARNHRSWLKVFEKIASVVTNSHQNKTREFTETAVLVGASKIGA